MSGSVDIRTTIRGSLPRLPYGQLARRVLGHDYELSVVLCGDDLARKMNKTYRGRTYAANVLSFPLSPRDGEIFLNLRTAAREAKRYHVSLRSRIALLFVHGLFHLQGFEHGDRMERAEQRVLQIFGL